jgi:hypothetical protein
VFIVFNTQTAFEVDYQNSNVNQSFSQVNGKVGEAMPVQAVPIKSG